MRRRGKIVIGAGFPKASPALIRECYSYVNLTDSFFKADVAIYDIFCSDGIFANLLNNAKPDIDLAAGKLKIVFYIATYSKMIIRIEGSCEEGNFENNLDLCLSKAQITLEKKREIVIKHVNFSFDINWIHFEVLKRRFYDLCSSVQGLYQHQDGSGCTIEYIYSATEGKYEPIIR